MNPSTLTSTTEPTGFAALPFVRPASGRGKRRVPASHWAVPATGGYTGGYATGMAMATLFLKFLRQTPTTDPIPLHLTWIVAAFAERFEAEGGAAMEARGSKNWSEGFMSLRGQQAGFFWVLGPWLSAAVQQLGRSLDTVDENTLLAQAAEGLMG